MGVFSVVWGDAETLRRVPETVDLLISGIREGMAVAEANGIQLDTGYLDTIRSGGIAGWLQTLNAG